MKIKTILLASAAALILAAASAASLISAAASAAAQDSTQIVDHYYVPNGFTGYIKNSSSTIDQPTTVEYHYFLNNIEVTPEMYANSTLGLTNFTKINNNDAVIRNNDTVHANNGKPVTVDDPPKDLLNQADQLCEDMVLGQYGSNEIKMTAHQHDLCRQLKLIENRQKEITLQTFLENYYLP